MKTPTVILLDSKDVDNTITINKEDIVMPSCSIGLSMRSAPNSKLNGRGFFLDYDHDWVVVKDNEGVNVLLRLKRGTL